MKNNFLLLAILLFAACTTKRDNDRLIMHNFLVPKTLSFDLNTQNVLQIDTFNLNIPDTLTMYKLDMNETIEMINVIKEAKYEYKKRTGRIIFEEDTISYDTLPERYHNRHFYIYGKLNLQSNINSIVLYDMNNVRWDNEFFCEKDFLLLNQINNKLYSIVWLDGELNSSIVFEPPSLSTFTFLKNNIFTEIQKVSEYFEYEDYNFLRKIDCALNGNPDNDCFVKTYYTKYKVNEQGYIVFVK